MLPFEFIIDGPPVSQQTRRRERLHSWQATVQQEARKYWPQGDPPVGNSLMFTVIYFYDRVSLDTDNIVKPIQDALIGLVYTDDTQITDVVSRKRALRSSFRIEKLSPTLAEGFNRGNEFLYIRVDEAPNQKELE